ncbi:Amino acid adenylation domain-containing protein OS=Streptomyces microflavus OX=1919 GN=HUT09_31485 PE=3 SV=1 [Streptomyces microflavus]
MHATVRPADADTTLGDIAVYADDGAPLGRIEGFRAADVEKAATAVARTTIDSWLAETISTNATWRRRTPLAPAVIAARDHGWLVLADTQGIADAFATLAAARGERCHLVRRGDPGLHPRPEAVHRHRPVPVP